jgi:membrane-bound ClpP family serine protease
MDSNALSGMLFMLAWLGLIIGLVVWTVRLARQKGRSALLWGILGLLFNPIAIVVLACLGPARD